jgi:hypothetical protein
MMPRLLIGTATLMAALSLSACGGGDGTDTSATSTTAAPPQNLTQGLSGQKRQAAAAIAAYIEAFNTGDPDRICPLTSRTDAALARCKSTLPDFNPAHPQPPFELRNIEVHGARAGASIARRNGSGKPVQFQLQRVGGEWKIVVATLQG